MSEKLTGNIISSHDLESELGAWYNPASWFSSDSSKKYTYEEKVTAGEAWIKQLYNELKPNATFDKFVDALHLDAYNTRISEADYKDFLETVGFNFYENKTITDRVKASMLKAYSSNKNMLPNRKSIISAFLNPDNVSWTYWDATKIVTTDIAKSVSNVAKDVASVASGAGNVIGFIIENRKIILLVGLAGFGAFLYYNRKKLLERANEAALKKIGL